MMQEICPDYLTTVYMQEYKKKPYMCSRKLQLKEQRDFDLMGNSFQNNLRVNGNMIKSKVWPKTMLHAQEYEDYLKCLQACKKELHYMCFHCPNVRIQYIEDMLDDLAKTVYQHCYSPSVFESIWEKRRLGKLPPTNMKFYPTTYRTYYNRLLELESFKEVLYGKVIKDSSRRQTLPYMDYKFSKTTYVAEISIPAEKYKLKSLEAPIDQYTLRRI